MSPSTRWTTCSARAASSRPSLAAYILDMTTYDDSKHPRGQADNPGQFRDKANSGPEAALASPPVADNENSEPEAALTQSERVLRTPEEIASSLIRHTYRENLPKSQQIELREIAVAAARQAQPEEVTDFAIQGDRLFLNRRLALVGDEVEQVKRGVIRAAAPAFKPEGESDIYRDAYESLSSTEVGPDWIGQRVSDLVPDNPALGRRILELLSTESQR